jgi:hypothetical protein
MYDTIAHKIVTTFTFSSMCEAMFSKICHPTPLLQAIYMIDASRHIPGLPYISDERGQDIGQRHGFSLHKRGHQYSRKKTASQHAKANPFSSASVITKDNTESY